MFGYLKASIIVGFLLGYGAAYAAPYLTGDATYLKPWEVEMCEEGGGTSLECAIEQEKVDEQAFLSAFMAAGTSAMQKRAMRSIVDRANMTCPKDDKVIRSYCFIGAYKDAYKVRYPDKWN